MAGVACRGLWCVCVFGNISGVAICKKHYGIVPTLFGWVLGMPFLHILSFVSFFFRIVSVCFCFWRGGGGMDGCDYTAAA